MESKGIREGEERKKKAKEERRNGDRPRYTWEGKS